MSTGQQAPSHSNRNLQGWLARIYPGVAIVAAIAFFAQYYMIYAKPYINLTRYAAGTERMPFQARELMRYPLSWAMHSTFLQRLTQGHHGSGTPALLFTEVTAFLSLSLSCLAALKMYRWASPAPAVPLLPAAMLIVICLFDYGLSVPYGFPYDLPSVAFLGWGLWFIFTDRFWALFVLFPFATWNRETSLFLILAYLAVPLLKEGTPQWKHIRRVQLMRAGLLLVIWAAIFFALQHKYAANPSEAGTRILGNVHDLLNPMHWPGLLSASAFLIPYVWLRRDCIPVPALRACILILPFWFLFLLWKGQILELRIYGDVSVLVAVAAAIVFRSDFAQEPTPQTATSAGVSDPTFSTVLRTDQLKR